MNEFLSPDQIASASFETKRRGGLDPESVREHLRSAADTVAALLDEREGLVAELEAAQTSLANVPEPTEAAPAAELDEEALTAQLGQHAARVLDEARAAASDRIAEAEAEADDIRAAAEELHAERSMAADAEAQTIRTEAETLRSEREAEANEAAASIVAAAHRDAEALQSESSVSRDEAGQDAERIIRDAEITRRQILEDLARRRTAARRQIEQLRAGRERLMASHETVRRALDEITEELRISMSEARAAAETAGHSVSETTIEELEAEIETARLTGLLDTGPLPVVSSSTPANRALTSKAIPTSTQPSDAAESATGSDDSGDDEVSSSTTDEGDETDREIPDSSTEEDKTTSRGWGSSKDSTVSEITTSDAASKAASGDDDGDSGGKDQAQGLAPVVSLNQARSEVETRGHPAAGRDASTIRSVDETDAAVADEVETGDDDTTADDEPQVEEDVAEVEADDTAEDSEPQVEEDAEAVEASDDTDDDVAEESEELEEPEETVSEEAEEVADVEEEEDVSEVDPLEEDVIEVDPLEEDDRETDSVGALFASLRSEGVVDEDTDDSEDTSDQVVEDQPASPAEVDDAPEAVVEEQAQEEAEPQDDDEPAIDAPEGARRIKRVLADEQSRVMSTLKSSDDIPTIDELLGKASEHVDMYWSVSSVHLGGSSKAPTPMVEFVREIRRKVSDALVAGNDTEAAVDSMRSIYREIKTSAVETCVTDINSAAS